MQFPEGKVILGRLTNTAVGTAAEITFKDINGNAHAFAANERLIIDTIHVNNRATAKDLTIFQDADGDATYDSGEEVDVFSFTGVATWTDVFFNGLPSLKINVAATNKFYAFASATGAVDVLIVGQVIKD